MSPKQDAILQGAQSLDLLVGAAKKHLKAGQPALAIPLLKQARGIAPKSDDVLCALGVAYINTDDPANAEECFTKAHAIRATWATHFNLGIIALRKRQFQIGADHFAKAIEFNEQDYEAWSYLGQCFFLLERNVHALLVYLKIVKENPTHLSYKHRLASVLKDFSPTKNDPVFREAVMLCLKDDRIAQDDINHCFTRLIELSTDFPLLKAGISAADYAAFEAATRNLPLSELDDEFLRLGLGALMLREERIEHALTCIRRHLLDAWTKNPQTVIPHIPFLAALAAQCHLNEYIYEEDVAETVAILTLSKSLEDQSTWTPENTAAFLLLAAYRPVIDMPEVADMITAETMTTVTDEDIARVLHAQITDIRREREIKQTIPCLAPPSDDISQLVRAMYEQNPYPRWKTAYGEAGTLNAAVDIAGLRKRTNGKRLETLIAGCGTGKHIVQTQANFQDANITAIDLSFSSLAFAKKRCDERGFENVTFMQADILDLHKLDKQFDTIESVGVLHHMKDPMAGWRVLTDILKPGGYMRVGLYSDIARRDVVACRKLIEENGYPSTVEGIRTCRKAIKALPTGHPARGILLSRDFYSTSLCRDLVFHVQEHRFTLSKIRACLDELGLKFTAFSITSVPTMLDYMARHPEDPSFSSLDTWEAYEKRFPSTFQGMYQFWCQKPEG